MRLDPRPTICWAREAIANRVFITAFHTQTGVNRQTRRAPAAAWNHRYPAAPGKAGNNSAKVLKCFVQPDLTANSKTWMRHRASGPVSTIRRPSRKYRNCNASARARCVSCVSGTKRQRRVEHRTVFSCAFTRKSGDSRILSSATSSNSSTNGFVFETFG